MYFVDHANVPQYNQMPKVKPNSYVKMAEPQRVVDKNSPYSARQSSTLIYSSNMGQCKYYVTYLYSMNPRKMD